MSPDPLAIEVSGCTVRNDCVQLQTTPCALDVNGFYSAYVRLTDACAEPVKCVGHVELAPIPGVGQLGTCAQTPFSVDPGQSTNAMVAGRPSLEECQAVIGALIASSWKCVLTTDADTCFAGGADVCKVCP